jgi:hypothetical protein
VVTYETSQDTAIMRDKIAINVCGAPGSAGTNPINTSRADNVVLHLARLIGRQIAREQSEERNAKDRRSPTERGKSQFRKDHKHSARLGGGFRLKVEV